MWRFLVVFAFLLGPRLSFVDLHIVAAAVLAGYGALQLRGRYRRVEVFTALFAALVPIIVYGLLAGIASGGADFTIASVFLKFLLYALGAVGVVSLYDDGRSPAVAEAVLLRDVILAAMANAAFVVAFVTSPAVRDFAALMLDLGHKSRWLELGFRGADLSMGGGATASIFFTVVALIAVRHARSFESSWLSAASLIVLSLAALLTGRTGIVLLAVALPVAFALSIARPIAPVKPLSIAFVGPGVLVGGLAFGAFIVAFSNDPTFVHFRDVVLPWALEGVPWFAAAGEGNESLRTIVERMLFLPSQDWQVVIGAFNAGRSSWLPYVASDVGYVRIIYGVGLVGLTLIVIAHWPIARLALRHWGHSCLTFSIGVSLFVLVLTNFKELNLVSRGSGPLLALFVVGIGMFWRPVVLKKSECPI